MSKTYQVTKELAARIVADIKTAANADANVIGDGGYILASYDQTRVGNYHEGAHRILSGEIDEIEMTSERAETLKGARPGYIGVVKVEGRRVAVIAVTGEPEATKPIQKMAEIALREEILREMAIIRERQVVKAMEARIIDLAENMKVLALNGSIQAAKIGDSGKSFKVVVTEMRKLAEQINEVIANLNVREGREV